MRDANKWHESLYNPHSAGVVLNSRLALSNASKDVRNLSKLLGISGADAARMKVLDAPCGTGRHTLALSRKGMKVTGLDINPVLLRLAKANLKKAGLSAHLCKGNILKLQRFRNRFDLVINLFSSIGYFQNDKTNRAALRQLFDCLKPGGRLVIDVTHLDWLKRVYSPGSWHRRGNQVMAEVRCFDKASRYNEGIQCFLDLKTGRISAHYHRLRLYDARELKKIFLGFGAREVRVYGALSGKKFEAKADRRLVLVIER
jgi:SAM-dependent methyltransferase